MTSVIYHLPETKTKEALKKYLSNVSALTSTDIFIKFSDVLNAEDEIDKPIIRIFIPSCTPDDTFTGNWTVSATVEILTPLEQDNEHDEISGIVTDELSRLLPDGEGQQLSNASAKFTCQDFIFGTRKTGITGNYISTEQECQLLISPS